jgi:sulfhydrogenase subunit gamma (sulfur reductase)
VATVTDCGPYLPREAEVIQNVPEARGINTLRLRLVDSDAQQHYDFVPGQFNMLYLHGVGEVPISIVSDPDDPAVFDHAIRAVGGITRTLVQLEPGDRIGIRGPYGRGWPMDESVGRDVLIVTGGLGCAPVVSVINYIERRRADYGRVTILQGVKHSNDLIWRERYERFAAAPHTRVLMAADVVSEGWTGIEGPVTALFEGLQLDISRSLAMMCGPERMMQAAASLLQLRGLPDESMFLSMERNMRCGIGHCGHCQIGPLFCCHDGPVFRYDQIKDLYCHVGF